MSSSLPPSACQTLLSTRFPKGMTILEWIAICFSRGSFLTQGLSPGLLHCKQILYHLSHLGNPIRGQRDWESLLVGDQLSICKGACLELGLPWGQGVFRRVQGWNFGNVPRPSPLCCKFGSLCCSFPGGIFCPKGKENAWELSVKFLYCSVPSSGLAQWLGL